MPSRLGFRLIAVLVPAVALVTPSIAHAEKVVTEDSIGDVQQIDFALETTDPAFVPAPDETSTDIVRTVAAHGMTRLSMTVHFRDLLNTSSQELYIKVLTPRGAYIVAVGRVPGSRVKAAMQRAGGREVECRGLRAKFDGGADVMSVSVPALCLDEPRWVQLGVGAISFEEPREGEVPETFPVFVDDGHRDTVHENSIGKGPRIHRG